MLFCSVLKTIELDLWILSIGNFFVFVRHCNFAFFFCKLDLVYSLFVTSSAPGPGLSFFTKSLLSCNYSSLRSEFPVIFDVIRVRAFFPLLGLHISRVGYDLLLLNVYSA